MQSKYSQRNRYQTNDETNIGGTHKSFDNILNRNFDNLFSYSVLNYCL